MIVRYATSVAAGAIVTAALIFWMQLMIANRAAELPPRTSPQVWLISKVITTPPPERRPPPPPPEPLTTPPNTLFPVTGQTTVHVASERPVTPPGPPSPSVRVDGRQGPWISDAGHSLLARIEPNYPHRALVRELEGSVIVEFTITRHGTVTDIRVVESTNPVFEPSAVSAVARTRYRPRVVDGAPVESRGVTTEIVFELEN